MQAVILVGLGGAIGSMARFLISRVMTQAIPHAFPWGTFFVNITGCFLIGLFFSLYTKGVVASDNLRFFLMAGICGGFTTFSAFTLEGMALIRENKHGLFFLYMAASVLGGLAATWLGIRIRG